MTDRDEDLAPSPPDLQARNQRRAAAAQVDDEIIDAGDPLNGPIDERAPDDLGQTEEWLSRDAHQAAALRGGVWIDLPVVCSHGRTSLRR
jgi:hypothetical protein